MDSPLLLLPSSNNITPIDGSCYKTIDSLILQENFSSVSKKIIVANAEKTLKTRHL